MEPKYFMIYREGPINEMGPTPIFLGIDKDNHEIETQISKQAKHFTELNLATDAAERMNRKTGQKWKIHAIF